MNAKVIGLALGVTWACFAHACQDAATQTAVRPVITGLIDALNSKSEAKVRQFVSSHLIPNAPVEQRVKRWMGLSENGAPFKISRELTWASDQATVVIVDRLANRIALTAHFESRPRVMLAGIQLAAAYTREGLAPELAKWTDLPNLAALIAKQSHCPAMGIAIIKGGDLSEVAYGVEKAGSSVAVHSGEIWSIGSIGKPLCSTVVARLVEMGKLGWQETLKQALSGIPMDPACEGITLDQLMRHRSGIRADLNFKAEDVKSIVGTAKSPSQIRENYARNILKQEPLVPPDSQFLYSNAGYALLSVVVEKAYGKSYEQALKELVFKPLGLVHSYTGIDALPARRPRGHFDDGTVLRTGEAPSPMEFMFAGAGSGIYMSMGDLAKFGQTHLKGLNGKNGLLSAKTIQYLHSGQSEGPRQARLYACGWGIESLVGTEPFHGHNGSNGTMRAQLAIFPKSGLVVAAAVNRGGESEPSPAMNAVLALGERFAPKR